MNGANYANYSSRIGGVGHGGGQPVRLRMVGGCEDRGGTPKEAPRYSGSRTEGDKRDADRTMVERLKSAFGLDIRPRLRALEVEIGWVRGWIEGADARDEHLAEAIDALMADKL